MSESLDLAARPLSIHIVGVGGAGMRAIASVLVALGHRVSGSDMKPSAGLDRLATQGVTVAVGHQADNLPSDVDLVAVSTAIPATNPEVVAAHERGVPVLPRAEMLSALTRIRRTLSVSGTHGKTTTTTMLALVLVEAGLAPSFIVGGDVNEIGTGAVWDDGELFVVEADESDGTFTELVTDVAVVTNVEADHLDYYGDMAAIEAAFDRFVERARVAVVCRDEPNAAALAARHGSITYGTSDGADYRIVDVTVDRVGTRFSIEHDGAILGEVELPIPGLHNARNATAAVVAALEVGAPFEAAAAALGRYAGVARRYQFRGRRGGVTFVDDYAHNPGKVSAVVSTAAQGGWGRVVVVFQPHRYSRTEDLWREFGPSFDGADLVVITDIDGAGEQPRPGITGRLVVDAVALDRPDQSVEYIADRSEVAARLAAVLRPGDLCLTLGAGEITGLPDEVLNLLDGAGTAPRDLDADA